MIEYATLREIWWVIFGFLLAGFAVMDGFDLGVVALLPFVAKNDIERRLAINTVGPVWEGNQVWFILGGGAIFAAWPYLYAVSFSGFYLAMFLVLLTFIMRPVGFKYRSKLTSSTWRSTWDWILCVCGIVAALVFGVAVGNVLQGVPFRFDSSLRSFYDGTLWGLFNPFGVFCGVTSVAMLMMQGGYYLAVKTTEQVRARTVKAANIAAVVLIILFALGGVWIAYGIKGYVLLEIADYNAVSNPVNQAVAVKTGAWINNYYSQPWMMIAPILGLVGPLGALLFSRVGRGKLSFVFSSIGVFFVVATVGVSMFPFILPSNIQIGSSLMVWSASASQLSLMIMFISAVIFMPIILLYTAWVYRVLRGQVTMKFFDDNKSAY